MTVRDAVALVAVVVGTAFVYSGSRGQSAAEAFAAERDSVAAVALDSAQASRERLQELQERHADTLAAYGDSLTSWAAQAAVANERALVARAHAVALADTIVAMADSATVEAFNEYRRERDAEVASERERREIAERQVGALEVQVGQLTAALDASMAETDQVRAALLATQAAEEALARELRARRGSWYWKVGAVAGWLCAAGVHPCN